MSQPPPKAVAIQPGDEPGPWLVAATRIGFLTLLIVLWWIASVNVARNIIPSPWATLLAAGGLLEQEGDGCDYRTTRYRSTDPGRRVLAGDASRVEIAGFDRWFGGSHLDGSCGALWWRKDQRFDGP